MATKTSPAKAPKIPKKKHGVRKRKSATRPVDAPILSARQIVAGRLFAGAMSQKKLAELIGLSQHGVSNLETGVSRAYGETAENILRVFLEHGVIVTGPFAAEIYRNIGVKPPKAFGEGVQLVEPDAELAEHVVGAV